MTPLSPLSPSMVNARSPDTVPQTTESIASCITTPSASKTTMEDDITWDDGATSSPFEMHVDENKAPASFEILSDADTPSKKRSPTKAASRQHTPAAATPPREESDMISNSAKSERGSPLTNSTPRPPVFSIAPPSTAKTAIPAPRPRASSRSPSKSFVARLQSMTADEPTLRDNEGLTMAINMMDKMRISGSTSSHGVTESEEYFETTSLTVTEDATNIDDTCFSTFSEVPNADMTMFAKLGRSPTKQFEFAQSTPRANGARTPRTVLKSDCSPSPTPSRTNKSPVKGDGDTTNLLIDFTTQFENFSTLQAQRSQSRRTNAGSPAKMNTEPDLRAFYNNQRSPAKTTTRTTPASKQTILNLLDFDLPPAPTPRSIPTITVRELESLKSQHLSVLSSLKATLSGREAEVESLKRAVADAERRAGEAAETVREERSAREHAELEKSEWERRGREFEEVLRKIRAEVIASEREREDVAAKLEEAEKKTEEAEARASDAEARAAEAASKVLSMSVSGGAEDAGKAGLYTAEQVHRQIEDKVHQLSTELHAIYKKKHVTKVAGLKKGFEAKTKERTAALQDRIEELVRLNEELQLAKDATLSGVHVLPSELGALRDNSKRFEEANAELEEQKARVAGLEEEVRSVREQHGVLIKDLEVARIQNGELVVAVEDMLALQASEGAEPAIEDFKKSISRPSGLRGPGFGMSGLGESRIGRFGGGGQTSGLGRNVSGGKSRIMSDIEKMGGR